MDVHSSDLLGLPEIRERLSLEAGTEPGRALALAIEPSGDVEEVDRRRRETAEAAVLDRLGAARPGAAPDVRDRVEFAVRGGVLDPDDLAAVSALSEVASEVATAVCAATDPLPLLREVAERIEVERLGDLAHLIGSALDGRGGLRDDASAELAEARSRLTRLRGAAQGLLRDLAVRLRTHLQETFVTERGGRPVLAVKASSRSAVPGIVHDGSGSGQTIFVEPMELVEANNRVREAEATEREEVVRVLVRLTGAVSDRAAELGDGVEGLGIIDLALARAALARRMRAVPVEPSTDVVITQARHPLLHPARAVPIDVNLDGVRVLLVSGPNTGGKTVALKTIGLLALMHQCGLWVPATRARLPVFDEITADIGDEQSIAASLSTFSGHLRVIQSILERVGDRSLVLLDEVMAGTDPAEGAALAIAVLERLISRGALVVTTTHAGELKAWAAERDGAENAAVGFDPDTLAPTFTLARGAPGPSNALQIAARLGLDGAIIDDARSRLTPERRELAAVVDEAQRARSAAERDRLAAAEERQAAEVAARDAQAREHDLTRERDRVRASVDEERARARADVERELRDAQADLTALRREIATARRIEANRVRRDERDEERRSESAGDRDRSLGAAADAASRATRVLAQASRPARDERAIVVGDFVIDESGLRGEVTSIRGAVTEVRGSLGIIRIPLARLRLDRRPSKSSRPLPPPETRPLVVAAPSEIDVRGQRAEVARAAVRAQVDLAILASRETIRVIHGHGTGALKSAIREELSRHPLVVSHEAAPLREGGDGVTVVALTETPSGA